MPFSATMLINQLPLITTPLEQVPYLHGYGSFRFDVKALCERQSCSAILGHIEHTKCDIIFSVIETRVVDGRIPEYPDRSDTTRVCLVTTQAPRLGYVCLRCKNNPTQLHNVDFLRASKVSIETKREMSLSGN